SRAGDVPGDQRCRGGLRDDAPRDRARAGAILVVVRPRPAESSYHDLLSAMREQSPVGSRRPCIALESLTPPTLVFRLAPCWLGSSRRRFMGSRWRRYLWKWTSPRASPRSRR